MNSDQRLVLDTPYRSVNRLETALGDVTCPLNEMISSNDRVLLIRLGGIGDAIRLLPSTAFLRNNGFDGVLHCAVEPPANQIMECTDYVDQIHSIPLKDWRTRLTDILTRIDNARNTVYDWVFDCHGILKSGVLSRLIRARHRIGYHSSNAKEANSVFMDHTISTLPADLPRLLTYLQLIRPFLPDCSLDKSNLTPVFSQIRPVRSDIREIANRHPILIHPSSSAGRYGTKKDWGTENFRCLIRQILSDSTREILITWGPGEHTTAYQIAESFPEQVQVAPETNPITNLAFLIQKSRMLITIDSSPAHFADLLGTPVVTIFGVGKTRVNAPFFAPYRMATREQGEEHTSDIPVDRVYQAYQELQKEIETSSTGNRKI